MFALGGQDRECERIIAHQVSLRTSFDPWLPRMCERVNCVSPTRSCTRKCDRKLTDIDSIQKWLLTRIL